MTKHIVIDGEPLCRFFRRQEVKDRDIERKVIEKCREKGIRFWCEYTFSPDEQVVILRELLPELSIEIVDGYCPAAGQ